MKEAFYSAVNVVLDLKFQKMKLTDVRAKKWKF